MTAGPGGFGGHDLPSDADLDATDRLLSSIATRTGPIDEAGGDPVTELLRTASGPAGAGELVGSDQFVAAVSSGATRDHRTTASPAGFVGKAVAVKAAVIAAVTVLGIAGAGAATGVILQVANDPRPQPVVTVDDPDATSPEPNGDVELGDSTDGAGAPGAGVDAVRVRTCAEATDRPGLEELARAADVASSTAADYCRGTGTIADPDHPAADTRADLPSSGDASATARRPASDPDAPSATPGPPAANGNGGGGGANGNGGGANNGGSNNGGQNNGVGTPQTPNTNANPKSGNGATNGGGNNSNANNGGATPQTPNTNANPKAGNGATNGGGNNADAVGSSTGARGVDAATGRAQGRGTAPDASTRSVGPHRSPTASGPATPPDHAMPPGRSR